MSEIKLFSYLDSNLSKETMQIQSNVLIQSIVEGEIDPLQAVAKIRFLSDALNTALKDDRVKDAVLSEIDKNGGKEATSYGVKFTQKEMGVSYDYSVCGDPEYDQMALEMEALKAKMKEREEYLKHIPELGQTVVNEETGEVYKIYRPARMATETIQVVFAK